MCTPIEIVDVFFDCSYSNNLMKKDRKKGILILRCKHTSSHQQHQLFVCYLGYLIKL